MPHPHRPSPRLRTRGFTLVELLTVIAIIGIMATMSFGLFNYVQVAKREAKARGEIALLGTKLEEFKARFGEYPMAEGNSEQEWENTLFNALTGRWLYQKNGDGTRRWDKTLQSGNEDRRRPFVEGGAVGTDANPESGAQATKFVDPWGNAYRYRFGVLTGGKLGPAWDRPGFLLVSAGDKFTGGVGEADSGAVPDSDFFSGSMANDGVVPDDYFDDERRADNLTSFGEK